uniref:Uncharacterized protein n=1 Tax=viral metagenome TaxID=1070528 RepID=A0A6M3J508_9ZZZZ
MALHINTLDDLIVRIGRLHIRDWAGGTATGGSTTTIVDTSKRHERDDYWNNLPYAEAHIRSTTDGAAPVGETRMITDFVNSSNTITNEAFTAVVGSGDKYAIHTEYKYDEIVEAINQAISRAVNEGAFLHTVDASIHLVEDVFEYPVPSGFIYICSITMASDDGDFYDDPIPPDQYKIIRGMPTPRIQFTGFPNRGRFSDHYYGEYWRDSELSDAHTLRIEGLKKQEELESDSDTCYINPGFICPQAAAYLHAARIKRDDVDTDVHASQFAVQQNIANEALSKTYTRIQMDAKRVEG